MHEPKQIRKQLGEIVRGLRKRRGWSQEELAAATGFGRAFTSSIENGKKDVRVSTLVKLANIYGIHPAQLLTRSGIEQGPL